VLLTASYFPLVSEAFGCRLGTACGPNMMLSRRRCPHIAALVEQLEMVNRATMYVQKPHWLDYDPLALAVLVIGIGIVELLALMI
jgi:hypothetical protein